MSEVHEHEHEHAYEHEHEHEHRHEHEHGHEHTHGHEQSKVVIHRISKTVGHLEAIKRMVEDNRDCSEVLIQIAAVRAAVNNIGKIILQDHISHCFVDAVEHNDQKALDDLSIAIDKFMK